MKKYFAFTFSMLFVVFLEFMACDKSKANSGNNPLVKPLVDQHNNTGGAPDSSATGIVLDKGYTISFYDINYAATEQKISVTIVSKDTSGQETGRVNLNKAVVENIDISTYITGEGVLIGEIRNGSSIHIHIFINNDNTSEVYITFTIHNPIPEGWNNWEEAKNDSRISYKGFEYILLSKDDLNGDFFDSHYLSDSLELKLEKFSIDSFNGTDFKAIFKNASKKPEWMLVCIV